MKYCQKQVYSTNDVYEWQQRTVCPGLLQAPGALLPVDGRRRLARNLPTASIIAPALFCFGKYHAAR